MATNNNGDEKSMLSLGSRTENKNRISGHISKY